MVGCAGSNLSSVPFCLYVFIFCHCFYFLLICLNNETLPLDLKNSHHEVPITKDSIHNPGMKLSIFLQFWVCISVLGHSESVDAMS